MCARHTLILGLALPQSESLWRHPEIALAGAHQSSPPTSSFITLNVYSLCITETEQDHKQLHQARSLNKPQLKTVQPQCNTVTAMQNTKRTRGKNDKLRKCKCNTKFRCASRSISRNHWSSSALVTVASPPRPNETYLHKHNYKMTLLRATDCVQSDAVVA